MQSEVRVIQDERTEWRFDLDRAAPMSSTEARSWLDAQFTQLGSAPLRPTGKLLLADKVLVVARDGGPRLLNDPDWGLNFARAASAALGKPVAADRPGRDDGVVLSSAGLAAPAPAAAAQCLWRCLNTVSRAVFESYRPHVRVEQARIAIKIIVIAAAWRVPRQSRRCSCTAHGRRAGPRR